MRIITIKRRIATKNGCLFFCGRFDLGTVEMTKGDLPKKAQELVIEWINQNQKELLEMWDSQNLRKLPPL